MQFQWRTMHKRVAPEKENMKFGFMNFSRNPDAK